jgi:hypothetical protein
MDYFFIYFVIFSLIYYKFNYDNFRTPEYNLLFSNKEYNFLFPNKDYIINNRIIDQYISIVPIMN